MWYAITRGKDFLSRCTIDVRQKTWFSYESIYEGSREEETGNYSSFEIELINRKWYL